MKRIALFILFSLILAAVVGASAAFGPEDMSRLTAKAENAALRTWDGIEAYPVPVMIGFGTFLLTVVYHKLRGKSLRESVEVAATRVTVVEVPSRDGEDETPVIKRAKARTTWTQLTADQIALENRYRKLPDEVKKAEQDVCYTEQALADAEEKLGQREKAHEAAVAKLEALREDLAKGQAELAEIEGELEKLSKLV